MTTRKSPGLFQSLLLFAAGALIFWLLKPFAIDGGDTKIFMSPYWSFIYGRQFVWYAREPLAHIVVQVIDSFCQRPDNPEGWMPGRILAFQISSAFFGGLYLVVLSRFSMKPVFWAIALISSATWVFVGHLEYYAPVAVALALYYLLLIRALEPEPRATPAMVGLAFSLAFLLHKMALIFMPPMLLLMFTREGGRWIRRPWHGRQLEWGVVAAMSGFFLDMIPGLMAQIWVMKITRIPVLYVTVNEKIIELITPPTQAIADWIASRNNTGLWWVYLLGRPRHWQFFIGFLALGAPLGLPVVLYQYVARRSVWLQSDGAKALLAASVIGIVWIFFWHPRAMWLDWDIFAMGTLPINLLAGGILSGIFQTANAGLNSEQSLK